MMHKTRIKQQIKQNKNKLPAIKFFAILISGFLLLAIYQLRKENEVLKNGINNDAIVESVKYVTYRENDKSIKRINYYQIEFSYQFNGIKYETTQEIQVNDFDNKIGRKLESGDTLSIRHSHRNPKIVEITNQYE